MEITYLKIDQGVIKNGWYFYNEVGESVGPFKTEWDAELVASAYLFNYLDACDFLYLDLMKFIADRKMGGF